MISKKHQTQLFNRLTRIENQVTSLKKLINDESPDCKQVAEKLTSTRKALDKMSHVFIANLVEHSINSSQPNEPDDNSNKINELISDYC